MGAEAGNRASGSMERRASDGQGRARREGDDGHDGNGKEGKDNGKEKATHPADHGRQLPRGMEYVQDGPRRLRRRYCLHLLRTGTKQPAILVQDPAIARGKRTAVRFRWGNAATDKWGSSVTSTPLGRGLSDLHDGSTPCLPGMAHEG